jgi:hypothetical protein
MSFSVAHPIIALLCPRSWLRDRAWILKTLVSMPLLLRQLFLLGRSLDKNLNFEKENLKIKWNEFHIYLIIRIIAYNVI